MVGLSILSGSHRELIPVGPRCAAAGRHRRRAGDRRRHHPGGRCRAAAARRASPPCTRRRTSTSTASCVTSSRSWPSAATPESQLPSQPVESSPAWHLTEPPSAPACARRPERSAGRAEPAGEHHPRQSRARGGTAGRALPGGARRRGAGHVIGVTGPPGAGSRRYSPRCLAHGAGREVGGGSGGRSALRAARAARCSATARASSSIRPTAPSSSARPPPASGLVAWRGAPARPPRHWPQRLISW